MKQSATIISICLLLAISAAAQQGNPHKKTSTSPSPTIPAGTQLQVRVIDNLSSANAQPGQVFHGTLDAPIIVNGQTLYAKGADVTGRVLDAKSSGRLSAPGELSLSLTSVSDGTHTTRIKTDPFDIKGQSHTKSNVTKIGGGAAAGAVVGAIIGGGKGAAIGAGVGAAAGTGVAAATGKKEAVVESEAVLAWNVTSSTPGPTTAAATQNAAERAPMADYNDAAAPPSFASNDVRSIKSCFVDHASDLPPGLAKRESLPPGIERQLERNSTLPPGLQKKVQPLPQVCDSQLARLPGGYHRIIYGPRVMLVDPRGKILDAFNLE